jgi:hypothetical protein
MLCLCVEREIKALAAVHIKSLRKIMTFTLFGCLGKGGGVGSRFAGSILRKDKKPRSQVFILAKI